MASTTTVRHSYTPPRAAFAAADIEGIYFQAELPLWGSISPDNHRLNDFLLNEAYMTLDYMGNHPSFTMLGLGNELGGDVGPDAQLAGRIQKT